MGMRQLGFRTRQIESPRYRGERYSFLVRRTFYSVIYASMFQCLSFSITHASSSQIVVENFWFGRTRPLHVFTNCVESKYGRHAVPWVPCPRLVCMFSHESM